jgi:hypothetical protein
MTLISYEQESPRGGATMDSTRLLIAPDGSMFWRAVDGAPVPVSDEQRGALQSHFGPLLSDAIAAVRALA